MMIVVTLIALLAGLSFPSVAAGIESLRLRSAADSIAGLLTSAVDRAERSQEGVEVGISPKDNAVVARSASASFQRRVELDGGLRIFSVRPPLPNLSPTDPAQNEARRFLIYPGGAAPRIAIEIGTANGSRRRLITIDPLSGFPRTEILP